MVRLYRSFPPVALIFGALWAAVLIYGPTLRADDKAEEVQSDQCRSYPRRTADLEKWLRKETIPGQTKRADIISIFGTQYRLARDAFDSEGHVRRDYSLFYYWLDDLGIHDHPDYVLDFQFDARSGALLRAAVEEGERQTGFNINSALDSEAASGP